MYHFLLFLVRFDNSPHTVVDAAFIQILIRLDLVTILVPDSDQKKPPLPTINRNLPDNLIETLIVQPLSYRTKPHLPGLLLNEALVEFLA